MELDSLRVHLNKTRLMTPITSGIDRSVLNFYINLLLYSPYKLKRVAVYGAQLRHCACGQHSSFCRNVAVVVSRLQHCVRYDRLKI